MLIDAHSITASREFTCDLCVVGAGPAGIAIVDRLRNTGLSIVLLESGGFNLELPTQRLYRGEIHGRDYFRLDACRWRLFGGSSNRWGGWCRPLEPMDFANHNWLPHSGWPIGAEALQPYYEDTAKLLELTDSRFDLDTWRDRLPAPFSLEGTEFENIVFQFSPETNFGEAYRARVLAADNVTTLIHTNLTMMRLDPDSRRLGALLVSTLNGRTMTVRPKMVVLAAGGIENARLLLTSRGDQTVGLGNEFDMVGRFFMEHLHVPVGHMLANTQAGNSDFYRKAFYGDAKLRGMIMPTAATRDEYRLLNTSIAIEPPRYSFGTPFVGWPPSITFGPVRRYKQWRTGRFKSVVEQLKQLADHAHALPKKFRTSRVARFARRRAGLECTYDRIYSLYFRAEQAPDPSNRVSLSRHLDALGMPETRLDWQVKPIDISSITHWLNVFDRNIRAQGLGQVVPPVENWENGIIGGPHHMGTTRMSTDPRQGVVDSNCRVHSVENLYLAGSSVFTTGGYANPTFTLIALALRLADTLRKKLRS